MEVPQPDCALFGPAAKLKGIRGLNRCSLFFCVKLMHPGGEAGQGIRSVASVLAEWHHVPQGSSQPPTPLAINF